MTADAYSVRWSGRAWWRPSPGELPRHRGAGGAGVHAGDDRRGRDRAGRPRRAAPSEALGDILTVPAVARRRGAARSGPPTTPSTASPRRPARLPPAHGHRQLRRARRQPRAIVDDGDLLEIRGRMGVEPRHRRSPRSAAAPSASSPTNRSPSPGPSTSPSSQKGARFVALLRRVQPAAPDAGRHARLLPGQGPRVARHDPPRGPAGVRLRPGDRARGSA